MYPQIAPQNYDTSLQQEQVGALPQPVSQEPYSNPDELFSALTDIMKESGGDPGVKSVLMAAHNNPRIGATFQAQPELLKQLAWNPNARGDTPEKRQIAGVAGGIQLTNDLAAYAESRGIPMQAFSNPQAMQQAQKDPGFMDTVKNIFSQAQAKPGSPAAVANEAYFGTLTRGGGLLGAATAYATTYQQLAQQQGEVQALAMNKMLDHQIKTMDRVQQTQGIVNNTTRLLASGDSNLDNQTIAGISDQVGQISYMAKENPAGAEIQARQLAQSIFENPNVDDRARNKILSTLVSAVKIAPEQQKEIDQLRNAGMPDRVINKMAMGVSLEGEEDVIKRVKNKIEERERTNKLALKQGESNIEVSAANAKTLFNATDPRVIAGKLAEKYGSDVASELAKQNAQRVELGMPPMTMAEYDQIAARMVGGGGVAAMTAPATAPTGAGAPMAPAYGSQPAPPAGGPQPVVPSQQPSAPMTLADAKMRNLIRQQEADVIGKDLGTTATNIGKNTELANNTIGLVDNLLNHPGFSWAVGGQPLERVAGAISGSFRGTDVTDFNALRDQLAGQQFLAAFETLKGGGAITNKEGEVATRALATLSNPDISEAEFKRAAAEFTNTIKRGINRQRKKLGQPPLYNDVPEAGTTPYGKKSLQRGGGPQPAANQGSGGWKVIEVK
jgi:hypothetical protein